MRNIYSIEQHINETKEELRYENELKQLAYKIDKKYSNWAFSKIFTTKLKNAFSDNKLSKKEFLEIKDWLEKINNDLTIIKSYEIETSINWKFKEILTKNFEKQLNLLKQEILEKIISKKNY